jgi:hypothetical protein
VAAVTRGEALIAGWTLLVLLAALIAALIARARR